MWIKNNYFIFILNQIARVKNPRFLHVFTNNIGHLNNLIIILLIKIK